jgi:ribosomal 50S subunit-recycling heat shock protein
MVNDKPAKAGTDVVPGDVIHVEFGNSSITVKVVMVAESVRKDDAAEMYEVLA